MDDLKKRHGRHHGYHEKGRKGKRRHHIDPSIKPGSAKYIWASVSHNKGAVFGMVFLALIIVLSLLSPYICKYNYSATDLRA